MLVRPSGTEPVVRVMVEGADADTVRSALLVLAPPRRQPALLVPRHLYLLASLACAAGAAVGALVASLAH